MSLLWQGIERLLRSVLGRVYATHSLAQDQDLNPGSGKGHSGDRGLGTDAAPQLPALSFFFPQIKGSYRQLFFKVRFLGPGLSGIFQAIKISSDSQCPCSKWV